MTGGAFRGDNRLGGGNDPVAEGRIALIAVAIGLFFAILLLRLFQLQIVEGADLRDRSKRNAVRLERLEAPRGEIVDREGRVLATTRPAFRVEVIPNDVRSPEIVYRTLGMLLDRDPGDLSEQVGKPAGRDRFKPVVLNADLAYDEHARLESHRYALPGVVTGTRPRRQYVEHALAAHLLGTIGEVQAQQLEGLRSEGYHQGDIIGQAGLESRLESHLRGRAGGRNLVVDVAGREVEVIDEVEPLPGGRVVVTLDLDLQKAAEEAFRIERKEEPAAPAEPDPENPDALPEEEPEEPDRTGALVALDPRNGDVLAFLSQPAYDPNVFAGGIDSDTWRELTGNEWRPMQNRVIAGNYSPGSTYKSLVAVAGLAEGELDPTETVFCPGHFRLGRRTYRCWKRGGHGDVDLVQALVHSCDVYFYELGLRLGIDRLAKYARTFGLGEATGIGVAGEKSGLVPTKEWKERVKGEPWIKGETVSAAIGQGFNLVTPLQLAVAYAALVNGGTIVTPRLVKRLETWDGRLVEEIEPKPGRPIGVDAAHLERVKDALVEVVNAPRGTGGRARLRDVAVGGKTGTTQVVSLRMVEGLEDDEIPIRYRDHALFVAFAPAEAPEIVVAVLVEHGASGGGVAAPIARKVLEKYFEKHPRPVPPPKAEEPRLASD